MTGRIVGMDLGTTNSEVAALTDQGVVVLEEDGDAILPSCVGLSPDGRILVGREALNQEVLHPERTVRSVKRLMGTEERTSLGDETFRPQEISALILGALRDRAERSLGEPVTAAVITVPAYFSDAQRQATREAGEIAGLEVARILNEPTAAALAFPAGDESSRTILVYDLGGGTFDVSIVRLEQDVTEVLASHGDVRLGGDDFDRIIVERLMEGEKERALREAVTRDPHVHVRILRAAEATRRKLSRTPHTRIREDSVWVRDGIPHHVDREITREEFEKWIAPLLEKTVESVHRALEDAGISHRDLDDVLLAGGATRTPAVARILEDATGRTPSSVLHPDTCVALGAGLVAARLEGRTDASVLLDVTPYTFGPRHIGFRDGMPSMHMFEPLIRRNTPLPVSCTDSFYTVRDRQKTVRVEVFQGEDPDTRNNIKVGEFEVEGLADVPQGNEILIGLDLDVDGILAVTATERTTGLSRSISIQGAVGRLGEREVARARGRVARLLGREDESAEDLPAALSADSPLSPKTRDLVKRCEQLLPEMQPDDREEAENLLAEVRAEAGKPDTDEAVRRLEALLFYVGEGRT